MANPIPDAALDDRLGIIGTAGSGKTYNAAGRVERLLERKARCIIVDPLDVWWGLRLLADGKTASPFNVVILGGQRGDLPLNEFAGALIGETVAKAAESFIVSLGTLGTKAAERRFMLAFLTALYRHVDGEPVHHVDDTTVTVRDRAHAVALYREWFDWQRRHGYAPDLKSLRGRDLCCWCPLVDENGNPVPCHADVLLELANG